MEIREHTITFTLSEGDFETSMRRKPKNQEEFNKWAQLCERELSHGHIDWDFVFESSRKAMM